MNSNYDSTDVTTKTLINGYDIHDMLGTKMRALFQRKRGRDLFDLYWALADNLPGAKDRVGPDGFGALQNPLSPDFKLKLESDWQLLLKS